MTSVSGCTLLSILQAALAPLHQAMVSHLLAIRSQISSGS
jgi:hypothetical protein